MGGSEGAEDGESASAVVLAQLLELSGRQLTRLESIATRASVVLSLLIGLNTVALGLDRGLVHSSASLVLIPAVVLVAAGFVTAFFFALLAFEPERMWLGPGTSLLVEDAAKPAEAVRRELIRVYAGIVERNRGEVRRRVRLFQVAAWLLLADALLVVVVGLLAV